MEDLKLELSRSNEDDSPNASRAISSFMSIWLTSDPIGIKIIPSGWTDPRMYHVLVEWGDRDETDYHFLDAAQIKDRMDIDIAEQDFFSYIVTMEDLKQMPNDYELGNTIRNTLNKDDITKK